MPPYMQAGSFGVDYKTVTIESASLKQEYNKTVSPQANSLTV